MKINHQLVIALLKTGEFTVNEIARHLNCNKNTIYRIVKNHNNETHNKRNTINYEKVIAMLKTGHYTVVEIVRLMGCARSSIYKIAKKHNL